MKTKSEPDSIRAVLVELVAIPSSPNPADRLREFILAAGSPEAVANRARFAAYIFDRDSREDAADGLDKSANRLKQLAGLAETLAA